MMDASNLREVDNPTRPVDQLINRHAETLPQATRLRQARNVAPGYASNPRIKHYAEMEERGDPVLGQWIRSLRKAAGKRQVEVAAACGISRGHVSAIELGLRPVGKDTLVAMADFFGTTVDFILQRLGDAEGTTVKDELDAAVLMIVHQLPRDEVEAWLAHQMIRLRDRLKPS